ncbi:Formate hydrogenlyase subunit 3/Multisubunit Na+/H+ antiporter, MnhD subunit [Franzmannia pantelleriensis]|uniref:Formate hydrogenlyase subunit 3/Multisubunit Na+/H+ antiporter, MnhD subunit n=1 Tax=Franzmannia pantelleriensis TaxID=48727 RepID=A0A1G9R5Q7_9GAMM|nr:complex I subunit 5 family protein [Halomonas pantelleriensis]SDM18167.1 Formate hydrogenlyase subunit 3/Multisubunit Na+/H+ antiporter, MnhD subunit [Halomonas pantelleriensis]
MSLAHLLLLSVAWPLCVAALVAGILAWRHGHALVEQRSSGRYVVPPGIAGDWPYRWRVALWVSAPLPALAVALALPESMLTMEWWLLGGDWRLDGTRRALLGFTALLWALAGGYAHGYLSGKARRARHGDPDAERDLQAFVLLWPLTLAGNLMLILAEDIASFYTGFAIMTFAAYGLVVNAGTREAYRGGRAYLIMAILGEGMILAGLLWAAASAETLTLTGLREGLAVSAQATIMATLLWLGFGVKAGVIGLHVWLPLAHPVAPTPASAVLSGAMIKAGLLGWWQTLPLGLTALAGLGTTIISLGLIAAFAAALYGVTQRHPKAVLAYSSVSQMGMMTALIGVGLLAPSLWPMLLPALVLFAVHHGLNKGALFLGVGITEHPPRMPGWLLWLLLALPALSLAGALASGLSAKWMLKAGLYDAGWNGLVLLLTLAAVGTSLLMARTLWCQAHAWQKARRQGVAAAPLSMTLAWASGALLAAAVPWWLMLPEAPVGAVQPSDLPPWGELAGLMWPALLGAVVTAALVVASHLEPRLHTRLSHAERLPPGDLWPLYVVATHSLMERVRRGVAQLGNAQEAVQGAAASWARQAMVGLTALQRWEAVLRRWAVALMVVSGGVLWLTLMR